MASTDVQHTSTEARHGSVIAEILRESVVDGMVAGRAFRLGRSATYRALKSGEIPAVKIGGVYRCPTPPLREMLGLTAESTAA